MCIEEKKEVEKVEVIAKHVFGFVKRVEVSNRTVEDKDITHVRKYYQSYYKFKFTTDGITYRFCSYTNPELLLVDDDIYMCTGKEVISGREAIGKEWVIKYKFSKIGEIIDFPEVSVFKRDFRLGDIVKYGIKIKIGNKEYFDDYGVEWTDRYARAFQFISSLIS